MASGLIIKSDLIAEYVSVGTIGLAAFVLAAIQTTSKFADTANKLRTTAAKFANLRDRLEELSACSPTLVNDKDPFVVKLKSITTKWDKVRMASPNVPWLFWWWAARALTRTKFDKDHEVVGIIKESKPAIPQ